MIKSYKVASLVFSLKMDDENPRWKRLRQYAPFAVPDEEGKDKIFQLEVMDGSDDADSPMTSMYKSPREKGEPIVDLYKRDNGQWHFEMSPYTGHDICAWMESNDDFTSARLYLGECKDMIFGINNALMLMYSFRTACMDVLEMHASVIKCCGKAYLFLGHSGAGKSTHSRQWLSAFPYDCSLLNDDNPIVKVEKDGTVMVYGSPWSGKTPCYKNDSCPAGAFVRIIQAPENKIEKCSIVETYAALYSSSSGFKSDEAMADGLHSAMEKICLAIPSYELKCLPDEDAAKVCRQKVTADEC